MQIKSTYKLVKPIDTSKELVITQLRADKHMVEQHIKRINEVFKNETQEQKQKKLNQIIARDNAFNAAMQEVVQSFEFNYDPEELQRTLNNIKSQFPATYTEQVLTEIAKKIISKALIFEELQKQWLITVTDEEVDASLQQFYMTTNTSIREYKEDKNKYEGIRLVIRDEKTSNEILKRFKIKWDVKPPEASKTPEKPQVQ